MGKPDLTLEMFVGTIRFLRETADIHVEEHQQVASTLASNLAQNALAASD